jgi:hypothetical protein
MAMGRMRDMSDGGKIRLYRIAAVATICLWAIQAWRLVRGESIDSGPVALLWLVGFGLYLLAVPWSADARLGAKAHRASTPIPVDAARAQVSSAPGSALE